MIDAALNVAAEQVIEYSAYGALLQRAGNRGPAAAPQNIYQCAEIDEFGRDDSWVAIAVATDAQWEALRDAIGRPDWAMSAELSTHRRPAGAPRRHRRGAVGVVPPRTGDEIVETLWQAGVPVAKVMQPHRQTELPQLAARGFFEKVDHPVNGPASHSTVPVRFSTRARAHSTAGPRRCSVSTTTSCCANSVCPTPRSPHWRTTASSALSPLWVVGARRRASVACC